MRGERRRGIGLRHAVRGLAFAWKQRNLKIEVAAATAAVLLALWLGAPLAPVLLASGLVLSVEIVNTAVETVVDLVRPEHHPLAGRAKDLAAAAVLLTAGVSVAVGVAVLGPPLAARMGGGAS